MLILQGRQIKVGSPGILIVLLLFIFYFFQCSNIFYTYSAAFNACYCNRLQDITAILLYLCYQTDPLLSPICGIVRTLKSMELNMLDLFLDSNQNSRLLLKIQKTHAPRNEQFLGLPVTTKARYIKTNQYIQPHLV